MIELTVSLHDRETNIPSPRLNMVNSKVNPQIVIVLSLYSFCKHLSVHSSSGTNESLIIIVAACLFIDYEISARFCCWFIPHRELLYFLARKAIHHYHSVRINATKI